ncbi:unnamed protein product [Peniophora sp. CBMAI 1063]|nr:unnamed protein product [Peniophora sp. CBMAI 1063]
MDGGWCCGAERGTRRYYVYCAGIGPPVRTWQFGQYIVIRVHHLHHTKTTVANAGPGGSRQLATSAARMKRATEQHHDETCLVKRRRGRSGLDELGARTVSCGVSLECPDSRVHLP